MQELINIFTEYIWFPFIRYAIIAGVLIALCSSLLGLTLVMKRYSFIGSGLSNVAFCSTAIAAAISLNNNVIFVLPVMVISAVLLLRPKRTAIIKGDAALAMVSAGSLAIGYLIFNLFSGSSNMTGDICATMFGSTAILTLGTRTWMVWLCIALSALVIAAFALLHDKIFAVTFDEDFAKATGIKSGLYNTLLAVITGMTITLAMNLAGALLVSALIVFPTMTAMRLFKSFKSVTICSAIISVSCALIGLTAAIVTGTPVGATVVAVNILAFAVFSAIGALSKTKA